MSKEEKCDHTGKIELTCIGHQWLHEKCGEFVDPSKIIRKDSEECTKCGSLKSAVCEHDFAPKQEDK